METDPAGLESRRTRKATEPPNRQRAFFTALIRTEGDLSAPVAALRDALAGLLPGR